MPLSEGGCVCIALLSTLVVTAVLVPVYLSRHRDRASVDGKGVMLKTTADRKPIHSTVDSFVEYTNDQDEPGRVHLVYINVKPEQITLTAAGMLVPDATVVDMPGGVSMAIYRRTIDGYDAPEGFTRKMQQEVAYVGRPTGVSWTEETDRYAHYMSSWYSTSMERSRGWVYQLLTQGRFDEETEQYTKVVGTIDYRLIDDLPTGNFFRVLVRRALSIYTIVTFELPTMYNELAGVRDVVCPFLISKYPVPLHRPSKRFGKLVGGVVHLYSNPRGRFHDKIKITHTITTPIVTTVDDEDDEVIVDDLCFVHFPFNGYTLERTIRVVGGGTLLFQSLHGATAAVVETDDDSGEIRKLDQVEGSRYSSFSDDVRLELGGKYHHLYIIVVPSVRVA